MRNIPDTIPSVLLSLICFGLGSWAALGAPSFAATGLRCEYQAEPGAVATTEPRLSWVVESGPARGVTQSAFQILVATTSDLLSQDRADLWDSGKVNSDQSLHVVYGGKKLESGQRCFWKVKLWNQNGEASRWCKPARWTMGLLKSSDWHAQWIGFDSPADQNAGLPEEKAGAGPAPLLRKSFTISKPVKQATLFASALGVYEARLNGNPVSTDVLSPGWTDYQKRVHYFGYDVTRQLKRGENALGAVLGDGWYSGYLAFTGKRQYYGEHPGCWFK